MPEVTEQDDAAAANRMRRPYIITSVIVLYLICLVLTFRLHLDERITSMLPDSDPMVEDFKFILENIPATEIVYIDIENKGGPDHQKKHIEIADQVYAQLTESSYFSDVIYKFDNNGFINLLDMMNKKKYALFNTNNLSEIDIELSSDSISDNLLSAKRKLMNPSGLFLADQIIRDPLNLNKYILERLESLKNETSGIKIEGGRIISQDASHILIMALPGFPAVNTVKSGDMIDFLNKMRNKIHDRASGITGIGFSGNHIATYDNSTAIKQDVQRTVMILSAGILLIGFLFFRRKIFIVLMFIPTVISLTLASALMSFFTTSVSAIALGCGAVLVGITVDFAIHLLYKVDNSHEPVKHILKMLKKPIMTGALTTMTAFSCLLFSSMPGQRQMGLFSMLGVAGAAAFSLVILQYFIPASKKAVKKPILSLVFFCDALLSFRSRYFKQIIFLCFITLGISLYGLRTFTFSGDVENLNHLSPVVQKDLDNFLETWGGSSRTLVLIQSDTLESVLEKNDHLFLTLQDMEKKGKLEKITSLSPVLPSQKTQQQNIENWNLLMNPERTEQIIQTVQEASLTLGFSKNAFLPFYDSLKSNKSPVSMEEYQATSLSRLISGKVIHKNDQFLVLTSLSILDRDHILEIMDEIRNSIPGARLLDRKSFARITTELIANQFKLLLLCAAAGMILSLYIFMRNVKIVFITVLPVFLSVIITAGILGLLEIPVNLLSMLFVIFVFGVGVDFSIFLVTNELQASNHKSHDRSVTSGAVMICALTTTGGFISLAFAGHKALNSIGATGLTGMITSLILALVLIPVLAEKARLISDEKG